MENNNWLMVLAIISVVAIVAVFGMVKMTGYAASPILRESGVCAVYNKECGAILIGDKVQCEQCCALRYACINKICRDNPETCLIGELNGLQTCMDSCPKVIPNSGSGTCGIYTSCSTCSNNGCCWNNGVCGQKNPQVICEACVIDVIDRLY